MTGALAFALGLLLLGPASVGAQGGAQVDAQLDPAVEARGEAEAALETPEVEGHDETLPESLPEKLPSPAPIRSVAPSAVKTGRDLAGAEAAGEAQAVFEPPEEDDADNAEEDDADNAAEDAAGDQVAPEPSPPPATGQRADVGYIVGYQLGQSLMRQKMGVRLPDLQPGLKDGLEGKECRFTEEERETILREYTLERMAQIARTNEEEGKAFLAENADEEGVKVLESGLQYKVLKPGTGESPSASSSVVTHYRGRLLDGEEFDSSYKRGQPATFPVNRVIAGWTEALQLMKVGAKWELYIPADLAYGTRGSPPKIGPNSTLVFEVELLDIKK